MSGSNDATSTNPAAGGESTRSPVPDRRNWFVVARKDLLEARRSWQLYVLAAVFTVGLTLWGLEDPLAPMTAGLQPATDLPLRRGLTSMSVFVGFFVPLVVLVLGYRSVVGERESGSLRIMLGLPVSRHDLIVGTFLGRTLIVWSTLSLGFLVAAVPMWIIYQGLNFAYVAFAISTLLFSTVFVAMAVGISAATRTRGHSIALAISAFGLVTFLWDVVRSLVSIVTGVVPDTVGNIQNTAPAWYVFLVRARPGRGWRVIVTEWVMPVFPRDGVGDTVFFIPLSTPGPEPFYLDSWVLVLVLLAWGVVPLIIGFRRFSGDDIE